MCYVENGITSWRNPQTELNWVVVSNMFFSYPHFGKIPILTNIFQMGWFNHLLVNNLFHRSEPL